MLSWLRRRKYYIVTMSDQGVALELYKWGRFTEKEAEAEADRLNKEFPALFLVITGYNVRQAIKNSIRVDTSAVLGSLASLYSQPGTKKEVPVVN